jgi:hypothetical protein
MDFNMALSPVGQSYHHFPPLGLAGPEYFPDVAFLTKGAAAVKDFIAVPAQHPVRFLLINLQQGPVNFQNTKVPIIDGQGIGKTVENSQKELVGGRSAIQGLELGIEVGGHLISHCLIFGHRGSDINQKHNYLLLSKIF